MNELRNVFLSIVGLALTATAGAQVVRITEAEFLPGAGIITFSEKPVATLNPTYLPADYGAGAGAPTVTFEGFFNGQSLGLASPPCPPGAVPLTGCVIGTPSNPLTLNPAAPDTVIVPDLSNPTAPVLSGSPTFNGPVAVLFSTDLAAVGLSGGFFNAANTTAITAYRRDGSVLGSITNTGTGIEFVGLRTSSGNNEIAGLLFSIVGPEVIGFGIDNLRFGTAQQIAPVVTVPTGPPRDIPTLGHIGLALLGVLMAGLGAYTVRRRRAH